MAGAAGTTVAAPLGSIVVPPELKEFIGQSTAVLDSHGYASMMGVPPDSIELESYESPEDAPKDGTNRVFTDKDGTQRIYQNGVLVCTIPVKGSAMESSMAAEAREAAAKAELSGWRARMAAQSVELNLEAPPYEVVGHRGVLWYIDQPSPTAMIAAQSLLGALALGNADAPEIDDAGQNRYVSAVLLFLFVTAGKDDETPMFTDLDDALAFMDSRKGGDALRIVLKINEKFADFLAEIFQTG